MHTTTQDPSTHLHSVQELLFELDKMKNSGIGAIERLEYILDKSAPLVEGFDLADAFDVELRARNQRLTYLSDMDSSLHHSKKQWDVGPLQEDVREAAGRLFEHLDSFLRSATHRERKSEIDMLSAIWDYEPDLGHLYPGLTSWRPRTTNPPELPELQEFSKKKAALYEEIEANREPPQEWLAKEFEEFEEAVVKEPAPEPLLEQTTEEAPKYPLVKSRLEVSRVVASFPPIRQAPSPTEEPDLLRRESWTSALREATTDEWTFYREFHGHAGVDGQDASVLLWHANECEARLELTGMSDENVKVHLRVLMRGRLRHHHETFTRDEVTKLHLNPIVFVMGTLQDAGEPA